MYKIKDETMKSYRVTLTCPTVNEFVSIIQAEDDNAAVQKALANVEARDWQHTNFTLKQLERID